MIKFYYTLALIFLPLIALADPPLGSACWRANGTNSAYNGNDGFNCPHEVSQKTLTIQQLYAKGYRVVSSDMIRKNDGTYTVMIIIEKINLK